MAAAVYSLPQLTAHFSSHCFTGRDYYALQILPDDVSKAVYEYGRKQNDDSTVTRHRDLCLGPWHLPGAGKDVTGGIASVQGPSASCGGALSPDIISSPDKLSYCWLSYSSSETFWDSNSLFLGLPFREQHQVQPKAPPSGLTVITKHLFSWWHSHLRPIDKLEGQVPTWLDDVRTWVFTLLDLKSVY